MLTICLGLTFLLSRLLTALGYANETDGSDSVYDRYDYDLGEDFVAMVLAIIR